MPAMFTHLIQVYGEGASPADIHHGAKVSDGGTDTTVMDKTLSGKQACGLECAVAAVSKAASAAANTVGGGGVGSAGE